MTKVFPYDYDQFDFPNRLRLLTVPTGTPHIVCLYIVVQVGSRNETEPGKTGFAHLFEHMMFRGTPRFSPDAYDAVLKQAGAAQNAYTDDDLTVYHTTFTREDLPRILELEADRFQNLEYSEEAFRTEARAVLAEYNKDSAEPFHLLEERLRFAAFHSHPYKHTTMGFLADIERMPELYDFSRLFHNRYYRPEYTTIILAGDVEPEESRRLVGEFWGAWQPGGFIDSIPPDPPPAGPQSIRIDWPSPTQPLLNMTWRVPGYSDTAKHSAALDVLSYVYFSDSSALYDRLVLQDQLCDIFSGYQPDHADPYLYLITARCRTNEHLARVQQQVRATIAEMQTNLVTSEKLETVKTHLRYSFAMGMEQTEAVAGLLARYVALRRTPETIERLYSQYAALTPEDLRSAAQTYFVDSGCVTAELGYFQ